jgi:tetratricopeptide (TPR) repeat protein
MTIRGTNGYAVERSGRVGRVAGRPCFFLVISSGQKKGDFDAAIDSCNRAIKLRAKYPIAFSNRAYAYYLKGEHDRAIADATHAITLDPGLPIAHTNLGHALAGRGDARMAARSYRRALALDPDHTVAEETLEALEKLGVRADDEDED